jgi:ribonuclease-3
LLAAPMAVDETGIGAAICLTDEQVGIVQKEDLARRIAEITGYEFTDLDLLWSAFTHASCVDHRLNSNERLEFLGDAVLALVVCQEVFHRYPHYLEGQLTKIKSAVVSRRTCAQIARRIGLVELLQVGKGMCTLEALPSSLAAAVLEAIIAAIYLDSGSFEAVRNFILKHFDSHIERAASSEHQRNFKSQLQQYAQQCLLATPFYEVLDEKGPDHSKCFEVCVVINGRRFTGAWGPSKKDAEQRAAKLALEQLGILGAEAEEIPADADTHTTV